VARIIAAPDVVIAAEDIYPTTLTLRGDPANWINNDAINGQATLDGPGVVTPGFTITLSKLGPYWINENPGFLDEIRSLEGIIWGSYDGTTNAPTVYPDGTSIQDIELQLLSGGSGGQSSPWTIPNSFSTNSVGTTGGGN
jgi:hypothetical protein